MWVGGLVGDPPPPLGSRGNGLQASHALAGVTFRHPQAATCGSHMTSRCGGHSTGPGGPDHQVLCVNGALPFRALLFCPRAGACAPWALPGRFPGAKGPWARLPEREAAGGGARGGCHEGNVRMPRLAHPGVPLLVPSHFGNVGVFWRVRAGQLSPGGEGDYNRC